MNGFSLLFPDFAMIAAGFVMVRTQWLGRSFWEGAEKLVYFVFFPALLFAAISRSDLALGETAAVVQIAIFTMLIASALGLLTRFIPGLSRTDWASGVQCAFRFNTYIAFAVASRAAGSEGLALMAVTVGFTVPLANLLAVSFLANTFHPGRLLKELSRNPLILGTVAGLAANLLSLHPPEIIYNLLDRASSAALALGLLCVGAGLSFAGIQNNAGRIQAVAITGIKLLVLPAIAWGLCFWLNVTGMQRDLAILFAAMPTATSSYILAVRMGGNGPLTAGLVSLSTLVSMATITAWYALL
jgi:malonate transporter and related proteins